MTSDQRFRPEDRLRKQADYERVFQRRCSVRGKYMLIYGCENDLSRTRLGRVVGKRWGNAVVRNRIRRWMREAFRQTKANLPQGLDLVVMPYECEGMNYQSIIQELPHLASRLANRLATKS